MFLKSLLLFQEIDVTGKIKSLGRRGIEKKGCEKGLKRKRGRVESQRVKGREVGEWREESTR